MSCDEVHSHSPRDADSAATIRVKGELYPTNGVSRARDHFKNMKSQSEFKVVNMDKIIHLLRLESFNCREGTTLTDALTGVEPF